MKQKNNGGYTLMEVLVAIVILGVLSAPVCTSLVVSSRMNVKTTELLQAQLAVSSAVETLMAEGITGADETYDISQAEGETEETDHFPDVSVKTEEQKDGADQLLPYYKVTVESADGSVTVTTFIRKAGGGT